jgi:HK97 family phage portal protein
MLSNLKKYLNNLQTIFLGSSEITEKNKKETVENINQLLGDRIVVGGVGSHHFHENIIEECYKNPVAVGCINYLTSNLRRFQIQSNFSMYFPQINIYNLLESMLNEWLLYGNCFLEIKPIGRNKYHLFTLLTRNVNVNHHREKITSIKYLEEEGQENKDLRTIIHLKNHNPFCKAYGLSPINVVSNHILQYNYINNYLLDIASRGGLMSGIIFAKQPLQNKDRQALQEQIRRFYDKVHNTGTIMVLEGDLHWEKITLSPQDLELRKSINQNACAIARGLGVPPLLIGLDKRGISHSGLQHNEVRKQFILDTLSPLYQKIIDLLIQEVKSLVEIPLYINIKHQEEEILSQ